MEAVVVCSLVKCSVPTLMTQGLYSSFKLGRVSELTLKSQVTFNYHHDSASWTARQSVFLPACLRGPT